MTLMVQAAVLDGLVFDAPPFSQDGFATTKIDVGWRQVADAFVVAVVGAFVVTGFFIIFNSNSNSNSNSN